VPAQVLATCGRPEGRHSYSLLSPKAYQLERTSSARSPSPAGLLRSPNHSWCWNINQLSIAYALRPRLRPD
jgi:hypothetical protein